MPLCPGCAVDNDAATAFAQDGAVPSDGDVTVCAYCGALGIFTDGCTRVRRPTEEERAELLTDPEVLAAMRAVRDVNRQLHARDN